MMASQAVLKTASNSARLRLASVVLAGVLAASGCSASDVAQPSGTTTAPLTSAPSSSKHTTKHTTSMTSPSSTVTSTVNAAARARLSKALYEVAAQVRVVTSGASVVKQASKSMSGVSSAARKALNAERSAAYGSQGKSCSGVATALAQVRAAAARRSSAQTLVYSRVSTQRDALDKLARDVTAARRALAALGTNTAGISTDDAMAALKSASSTASRAGIDKAASNATEQATTISQARDNAERIAQKAC